jgi:acetate kinase
MRKNENILTINGGSSSIKFSLYKIQNPLEEIFTGQVENIGSAKAILTVHNFGTEQKTCINFNAVTHNEAAENLINWLEKEPGFNSITAIGHRMVHGMQHKKPEIISPELLEYLKTISLYDPEHLPEEIKLIEIFSMRYPLLQQVACFDTCFHTSIPTVAKMLAIPRRYYDKGIYR